MPPHPHKKLSAEHVACAVICVSDTRTPETDESGRWICEALAKAGHSIYKYEIVRDEPLGISDRVTALCEAQGCQSVLLTGGTGLAPRDSTYEAIIGLMEKRLDGFGELFRMLSYAEIGSAAMFSRAVAGVRKGTAIFAMPGSTGAVRLALERLILPELGHLVWLVNHPL